MSEEQTAVLIVGGGLTGLSAAVFLSWLGTPAIVVERHTGVLIHPRARTVNPRSAELFRQVGLEPEILSARSFSGARTIIHAETLAGAELDSRQMEPPEETSLVSPCSWIPIGQDQLEVILRSKAQRLGADVRFGTELTALEVGDAGVTATIRDLDGGTESVISARYLIAADGTKSSIRRQLGIPVQGPGTLGHTVTFVFEADLTRALRGRPLGLGHLRQPIPGTVLMPHDGSDRWLISFPYSPDDGDSEESFTPERTENLIRSAIGLPGLEIKIVPQLADGTTVLGYDIAAFVAERFRAGSVFLAGDSAHVMPPSGAFGSATGIQDAHNLAWKLAAVVAGKATPDLLDSYEAERRPVAQFTVRQATLKRKVNSGRASAEVSRLLQPSFSVIFGYCYPPVAVGGDGDAASVRELCGQPGTRAPHAPVRLGDRALSTIDLYGTGFVGLAGRAAGQWADALASVFSALELDIDVYRLGTELADPGDRCADAYQIGPGGAAVIRPDGIVAWRTSQGCDPAGQRDLTAAIVQLMCPAQTVPA